MILRSIAAAARLPRRPASRMLPGHAPRTEIARALHGPSPVTHRHPDRGRRDHRPGRRLARGARTRRASRRSATSTSSIRRWASCSPKTSRPRSATCLTAVQHDLFDLGGELSIPGHAAVTDAHVERLEAAVETFNADLPPLKEFILPGGTRAAALAHVARTVCRRAERSLVHLAASVSGRRAEPPLPEPALGSAVRARAHAESRGGRKRRAVAEGPRSGA